MIQIGDVVHRLAGASRSFMTNLASGYDALSIAKVARNFAKPLVLVCGDDTELGQFSDQLDVFASGLKKLEFPGWDCLPYDRVSPSTTVVMRRLEALRTLRQDSSEPFILLTTVSAVLQRLVPVQAIESSALILQPGSRIGGEKIQQFLGSNGYVRTGMVIAPGEFAIRGGLLDLFPSGATSPVRLDFFGDALESIRQFDFETQRTTGSVQQLALFQASEVPINSETIAMFRKSYAEAFGGIDVTDPLYEAVTAGRSFQGVEHWQPLFYGKLDTIFDYIGDFPIFFAHQSEEAVKARYEQIHEFYDARVDALKKQGFGGSPYKPLAPHVKYLTANEFEAALTHHAAVFMTPFDRPGQASISFDSSISHSFVEARANVQTNVYDEVKSHLLALQTAGKRVVLGAWTEGSQDRLVSILRDHQVVSIVLVKTWQDVEALPAGVVGSVVLPLERGFVTRELAVVSEQDILGERLVRKVKKTRKAADLISELATLSPGDLMVHVDHGIGRFEGLHALTVQGSPHDCLLLVYQENARLYIPVENIDLLSRYGSESQGVQLDKLGGSAWQAKKAKLKQRIREIAGELIKTAAARELVHGDVLSPPEGAYDEFCARFPYEETEDQLSAIEAVLEDLQNGRPMDRLICGDVGFGKTEVALRAAFVTAYNGKQVAIVVPTTLLCRQHYRTFSERFKNLPVSVGQASRLVGRKELDRVKACLEDGSIDIVVGTHALLTGSIKFRELGLLVIDEEQHFGVKHKEKLKEMKSAVHVLTLTATPIPRTLQLSFSGLREMSLITTPPLDRLAVRTFISPLDEVVVREYLLREHFRGGQSFYVVPRISDLDEIGAFLREHVPEVKFRIAHGRMSPTELEDIMNGFYDRGFDVLVSTTIVESGLDIPTANTMIIHRSDMFGLAQLYQLRGRVGRSKQRAYALLTVPSGRALNSTAERRLKVLQSLDTLGAGFTLASHDLDLRGAGNILGEEQHGNIREVGFELYQSMLEDAVASLKPGSSTGEDDGTWSPQINIGTSVLIPEYYVADLQVRLALYRRLSDSCEQAELDGFGAELHDRFGKPPDEVQHLLDIVSIKLLCKKANVQSVDSGAKGATVVFRNGIFSKPQLLVNWIADQGTLAKLRPDMRLVLLRDWTTAELRLKGTRQLLLTLVKLAA